VSVLPPEVAALVERFTDAEINVVESATQERQK
jgi:hypothetical protein